MPAGIDRGSGRVLPAASVPAIRLPHRPHPGQAGIRLLELQDERTTAMACAQNALDDGNDQSNYLPVALLMLTCEL